MIVVTRCIACVRIKFAVRETHLAEHRAGIGASVGSGFFVGQTEIARRKHYLNGTFHSDDGKHPDCHVDTLGADVFRKIAFKASAYPFGYCFYLQAAAAERAASFDSLYVKAHGRRHLDGNGGKRRLRFAFDVAVGAERIVFGIRRKNGNVLFAAVKDDLFVKCREALNFLGTSAAKAAFKRDAEIESHAHLIESLIERNCLERYIGIYDFNVFAAYRACSVDYFLIAVAEADSEVFETVFISRGIEYLIDANAAKIVGFAAYRTRLFVFDHLSDSSISE